MARSFIKPVEPNDLPAREQEAISIFADAGWGEDSKWMAPLALSVFEHADGDTADSMLGDCAKHNIEVVANSLKEAGGIYDRDQVLLVAFARLCDCSGKTSELWYRQPSLGESPRQSSSQPGWEEYRRIAAEFRADRSHAKGANFENALVSAGWPGEYETDAQLSAWVRENGRRFASQMPREAFGELPAIVRLMHVLVDAAKLDLTKVIDKGEVVAAGVPRWGPDPRQVPQRRVPVLPDLNRVEPIKNARALSNWVFGLGPRAIQLFFPKIAEQNNAEYAAVMALGVRDVLEKWLMLIAGHFTYFLEAGAALSHAARPYFNLLHDRCSIAGVDSALAERRAWLWFARCTFEADPTTWIALDAGVQQTVLRAANEDLSRLRKLLARAQPRALHGDARKNEVGALAKIGETLPPLASKDLIEVVGNLLPEGAEGPSEEKQRAPWEEFEWERDNIQNCLMLLYHFDGVWRGLKPMLLAWRSLQAQAVARDLRYWSEADRESPPSPWCDLVSWPINLFHFYVGREQAADPDLIQLRGELASFCLERLADRWNKNEREEAKRSGRARTNDDMMERSPEWRYCLIRAAGTLGVNPEGKGHRILQVAAELDPVPEVRDAANQGCQQLRRNSGFPENVSPRRAIMSALWWIRQAHLLGLGIQPDPDGAQRTRVKELARTKEAERADKLATSENE